MLPAKKNWGKWNDLKVDKFQCIQFQGFRYSVPEKYIGQALKVFISVTEVIVYCQNDEKVSSHSRLYVGDKDSLHLEHYLDQLQRKPTAIPHAKVLKQATLSDNIKVIRERLHNLFDEKEANVEFIKILQLQKTTTSSDFEYALEIALGYGGVTSGSVASNIRLLRDDLSTNEITKSDLPDECQLDLSSQFNLSSYDSLYMEELV